MFSEKRELEGLKKSFQELIGKRVVDTRGMELGTLAKLYIDKKTGTIKFLGIMLREDLPRDLFVDFDFDNDFLLIPREKVISVSDFVVVALRGRPS